MKLALIPPISRIDDIFRSDYQLVLPNIDSIDYYEHYRTARRRGDYIILDNGAAEGAMISNRLLEDLATDLMVNEVVLPDVIADADNTKLAVENFAPFADHVFNYMAVVQGTTWDECIDLVEYYNTVDWITTIGIPRHLIETIESPEIRAALAQHFYDAYGPRFMIHLLGTAPSVINELHKHHTAFEYAHVRGVDTSAPFNYAWGGFMVARDNVVPRPEGYFQMPLSEIRNGLLEENIKTMQEWVNGSQAG
jgi:hypothetical protein